MAAPRTYRTEALSLRKMPLGEADLLLILYTRDAGKLRAVAKGARKTTSKLVGYFEPLTLNRLALSKGRNLDIVTQAQVIDSFSALKSNLTGLTQGLYIAELLDGFGSESNPNPELYQLSLEALRAVGRARASEMPLRFFELHLLRVSGLMPELYDCVECRRTLEPGQHRFSTAGGGTLCLECQPPEFPASDFQTSKFHLKEAGVRNLSLSTLKVLRMLHRTPLLEIPDLKMGQPVAQELKSVLGATVRYWLEKEIRSNSFLEHLQHLPDSPVYF